VRRCRPAWTARDAHLIEFYRWWIVDERTGKRRLTKLAMTREEAVERYPGAEPDLRSREVRNLPERGEVRGNAKPPTERAAEPAKADPAMPLRSSCAFCEGTGWVCAEHPALPFEHDDCGGRGLTLHLQPQRRSAMERDLRRGSP
jgi:hypothetical protein